MKMPSNCMICNWGSMTYNRNSGEPVVKCGKRKEVGGYDCSQHTVRDEQVQIDAFLAYVINNNVSAKVESFANTFKEWYGPLRIAQLGWLTEFIRDKGIPVVGGRKVL